MDKNVIHIRECVYLELLGMSRTKKRGTTVKWGSPAPLCPRWSYKCVRVCRASGVCCSCSSDRTVSQHFCAYILQCQQEGLWQNILKDDGCWFLHHNKPAVHWVL